MPAWSYGNRLFLNTWKDENGHWINGCCLLYTSNRYIKDTEVSYLYQHAHCVVYPYISATQSGVLSLAFYYNTPLLASDVPFFKSSLESEGTGLLFKNGDIDVYKRQHLLRQQCLCQPVQDRLWLKTMLFCLNQRITSSRFMG